MYIIHLQTIQSLLDNILHPRLSPQAIAYWRKGIAQEAPLDYPAFNRLIAMASRHARRHPLNLSDDEQLQIRNTMPGWDLAQWNLLELLRVRLIIAQQNLAENAFAEILIQAFQFADEGEACAFYKAIPLLPAPERFLWHMKEACRSNMRSIVWAAGCDNPFPVTYFDDIAWRQLVMKALFIEIPLVHIYHLEHRLSTTLANMANDYVAERTSAGRSIPTDIKLILGNAAC